MLACLPISQAHSAKADDIEKAISQVMTVNYGSDYDSSRDCYLYLHYCLTAAQHDIRDISGTPTLFLLISGYSIDESRTSRGSEGLGGLFVLTKLDSAWQVIASNPYLYNGRHGSSQLADFKLTKVGAQKYAWTGRFNSTGAGDESESIWAMLAPMANGDIKQVASLPTDHYYVNNTDDSYLKTEGDVAIADYAAMSGGFYPLNVAITQETGLYNDNYEPIPFNTKVVEKGATFTFNEQTQTYNSPLFEW